MPTHRARFVIDLLYEADKPLTSAHLVGITNKAASALRTVAVDDLDKKVEVIFDEGLRNQHAHHHDTLDGSRCRACYNASGDTLGPLDSD